MEVPYIPTLHYGVDSHMYSHPDPYGHSPDWFAGPGEYANLRNPTEIPLYYTDPSVLFKTDIKPINKKIMATYMIKEKSKKPESAIQYQNNWRNYETREMYEYPLRSYKTDGKVVQRFISEDNTEYKNCYGKIIKRVPITDPHAQDIMEYGQDFNSDYESYIYDNYHEYPRYREHEYHSLEKNKKHKKHKHRREYRDRPQYERDYSPEKLVINDFRRLNSDHHSDTKPEKYHSRVSHSRHRSTSSCSSRSPSYPYTYIVTRYPKDRSRNKRDYYNYDDHQ